MSSDVSGKPGEAQIAANPCKRMSKAVDARASARDRYLHGDALLRFWRALESDVDADVRDVIRLALFTGQRKGNVLAMQWESVNLADGVWTLRASETKQGTVQANPLSAQAREILSRRYAGSNGPWVFPATRLRQGESELGHMSTTRPRDAWERICKAANIEGIRFHDLRHTAGSWLARLGASEIVRQKALGHKTSAMAARYSHLELDPIADAMQRMGDAITAAATKTPASVVDIRGAK